MTVAADHCKSGTALPSVYGRCRPLQIRIINATPESTDIADRTAALSLLDTQLSQIISDPNRRTHAVLSQQEHQLTIDGPFRQRELVARRSGQVVRFSLCGQMSDERIHRTFRFARSECLSL